MNTWIGTSGFQYPEWKGKFYDVKLSTAKMLGFYASVFNSTEINYTFRSLPSEKTIARWTSETPEEFRFALKAPQRVTHFAKLKGCAEVMEEFGMAVKGLGKKLGPVLFQLPPTFKADVELLQEFLAVVPKGLRVAFEFRHESWFSDEVYETLAAGNAALCWAESEEVVVPKVATADFGYLRPRREDYSSKDIKAWAKEVGGQGKKWSEVFGYFKHEEMAVGPGFAKSFMNEMKG